MTSATALRRPPPDSLKFLLDEALRQGDELVEAKNSIDTRASFILGLLGVILTVFSGFFVSYWTSPSASRLLAESLYAWRLALLLTLGVMGTLVSAILLEILILFPRAVAVGVELAETYEIAANPKYDLNKIQEGTLRNMIPALSGNQVTYDGAIALYSIGSMISAFALFLAVEFFVLVLVDSLGVAVEILIATWFFVTAGAIIALSLIAVKAGSVVHRFHTNRRAEDRRIAHFKAVIASFGLPPPKQP